MVATKQLAQCSECLGWYDMKSESVFSVPLFRYPTHWFFLGFDFDGGRQDAQFCSWRCTKNFVDREYARHSHEDVNSPVDDLTP